MKKQRRTKRAKKRTAVRLKKQIVPDSVHAKIKRLERGPLLMRFVNSGELFELIGKGKGGGESNLVDFGIGGILKDARKYPNWAEYAYSRTMWKSASERLRLEDAWGSSMKYALKDTRKDSERRAKLLTGFQDQVSGELLMSSPFSTEYNLLKKYVKAPADFDAALRGDLGKFPEKRRRAVSVFSKSFRRFFSRSELNLIKEMWFNPEFLAKNPKQLNRVIKVFSKVYTTEPGVVTREHRFQYDTLILVDPKCAKGEQLNTNWYLMHAKPEDVLGVVALTRNAKPMMERILTATRSKPELRMPVFNRLGKRIWPPVKG